MNPSRRDFLKSAGLAAALVPAWDAIAAEEDSGLRGRVADAALESAKRLGASYADVRVNRYRNESISTRERQVQSVNRSESFGFGVRVLFKGAWGFAASRVVTPEEARSYGIRLRHRPGQRRVPAQAR
jgi:TldD protein